MSINVKKPVTVIIPVYADWPSLNVCLKSLKKYLNKKHQVILINDHGPEVEILESNIKKSIGGSVNFKYYRNKKNLGFVKTCNKAVFDIDKTNNDILLLNSDTEVTEGFLEEMQIVLYDSTRHATVSPRSNNATIATLPISSLKQKGIIPKDSFKLFLKMKKILPRYCEAPTAHGFCMLIRRSVIKNNVLFDEVFGKGYGEEVDFCQKLKKKGYISLLSNWSYVFHLEARSFSLEKKNEILEVNNKIIRSRYPNYQNSVKNYIAQALLREEGIGKYSKQNHSVLGLIKNLLKLVTRR